MNGSTVKRSNRRSREVQKLVATSARSPSSTSDSKRASETSGSECTRSSVIERIASEKAKNLIKREDV